MSYTYTRRALVLAFASGLRTDDSMERASKMVGDLIERGALMPQTNGGFALVNGQEYGEHALQMMATLPYCHALIHDAIKRDGKVPQGLFGRPMTMAERVAELQGWKTDSFCIHDRISDEHIASISGMSESMGADLEVWIELPADDGGSRFQRLTEEQLAVRNRRQAMEEVRQKIVKMLGVDDDQVMAPIIAGPGGVEIDDKDADIGPSGPEWFRIVYQDGSAITGLVGTDRWALDGSVCRPRPPEAHVTPTLDWRPMATSRDIRAGETHTVDDGTMRYATAAPGWSMQCVADAFLTGYGEDSDRVHMIVTRLSDDTPTDWIGEPGKLARFGAGQLAKV